jgi:rhodanese-related sulfurtransferase
MPEGSGLLRWLWWLPFGKVPEIAPNRLSEALREQSSAPPSQISPQILDVRTEGEWRRGHIAGAVNVPIHHLKKRLPELSLDRSRPVVAICLSAHRSIPAVRLLLRQGFDASQLAGGMLAWRRAHLPEVSQEGSQNGRG